MQKGVADERVEPFALGLFKRAPGGLAQASHAAASMAAMDGTTRAVKLDMAAILACTAPVSWRSALRRGAP